LTGFIRGANFPHRRAVDVRIQRLPKTRQTCLIWHEKFVTPA
jgi:hypothetical protein